MIFPGLPDSSRTEILSRARGRKVALPEGMDPRIKSASIILSEKFGVSCLLGNAAEAKLNAQKTLYVMEELSKGRGKTLASEAIHTAADCFFEAGAMLARREVDAVVGGASTSTAHVIRAALGERIGSIQACMKKKKKDPLS